MQYLIMSLPIIKIIDNIEYVHLKEEKHIVSKEFSNLRNKAKFILIILGQ